MFISVNYVNAFITRSCLLSSAFLMSSRTPPPIGLPIFIFFHVTLRHIRTRTSELAGIFRPETASVWGLCTTNTCVEKTQIQARYVPIPVCMCPYVHMHIWTFLNVVPTYISIYKYVPLTFALFTLFAHYFLPSLVLPFKKKTIGVHPTWFHLQHCTCQKSWRFF